MRRLIKEPLLHFLVVGGLLFVMSGGWTSQTADSDSSRIVVTNERVSQLKEIWNKRWGREPSEEELTGLVEEFVKEEMLYREGLALGLEKDDTIVRRRVAQKVKFLIEDMVSPAEPDEAALREFFETKPDAFIKPTQRSFVHVYFSEDERGKRAEEDAKKALVYLERKEVQDSQGQGDAFMLDKRVLNADRKQVSKTFGDAFADSLFGLELGRWQGPIRSGYGLHLVKVTAEIPASTPKFDEIRELVASNYLDLERRERNEEAMNELRASYNVVIEGEATDLES